MRTPLKAVIGLKIRAKDGWEENGFPEMMSTTNFYKAEPNDRIVLLDTRCKFNVATYSARVDDKWIYTYSYSPNQAWVVYNRDLSGDSYRQENYIFEAETYFRICLCRIDGGNFINEDINDIIAFEKSDVLRFALLADSHYVVNGTWDTTIGAIWAANRRQKFDGIIHLGDITDGMLSREICKDYANIVLEDLRAIGVPLWVAIGNHDVNYFKNNFERLTIVEQCELYLEREEPRYFIDFEAHRLRLMFLDSFDPDDEMRYGYTSECVSWVRQTLEATPHGWSIILFSHVTPLTHQQVWVDKIRNEDELLNVLRSHGNSILAFINGHSHADMLCNGEAPFPFITIGCAKCEDETKHKRPEAFTPKRSIGGSSQELWDVLTVDTSSKTLRFRRQGAGRNRLVSDGMAEWAKGLLEIWGHRGAYHFAPENTLAGFQLAADMGADGVELDIQLTRDGEVVVIHDEKVDRTSNGHGYVKDFTLSEIKKLNFNKRGITPPMFMEIPTLAEVFELLKPTGLRINVELKTGAIYYDGIERKALDIAKAYDMLDRIVWSSFNHYSVKNIKQLEPISDIALLCGGGILATGEECEKLGASALHPHINQINYPGLVEDCHSRGIKVRAWTVNEPEQFRLGLDKGVDAVCTNRLDIAKLYL